MVVRSALANGMDWQDLEDLVKAETANGNPIASLIHELRLDRNQASVAVILTKMRRCIHLIAFRGEGGREGRRQGNKRKMI